MTTHKSKNSGFTIIETLIVMAIAGLIFMIIFQAIPALVRNARNNQRKQDVAKILAGVSHYELNNTGSFPISNTFITTYNIGLSFYTRAAVTMHAVNPGANPTVTSVTGDGIEIYRSYLCASNRLDAATSQGAGSRDVVAMYRIETRSGYTVRCQQM